MEQDWTFWERSLAGEKLPMTTTPEAGYYKVKRKDGAWQPVVIWFQDGMWQAHRSGWAVNAHQLWEWCRNHPITVEAYEKALADGIWDEDDPTVASMIGHNVGSDLEALRDQIEAAEKGAEDYRGINNDEQAGRAQSLRARLNELAGTADKFREAEKKPHFEAGKKIDADWMPLIKSAKALANWLREEIAAWETMKLRERQRLEEERRRLEREREAEEARAREEARRAEEEGRPVVLPPAPAPVPPPPPPFEGDKVKGSYGRAASVTMEKVAVEITDRNALFQFLGNHPDLTACLLNLAQRALKSGHTEIPGVRIEERAKVS